MVEPAVVGRIVHHSMVGETFDIHRRGAAAVKIECITATQVMQQPREVLQGHTLRLAHTAIDSDKQNSTIGTHSDCGSIVTIGDKSFVIAHGHQSVMIDKQWACGHDVAVMEKPLGNAGTVRDEDNRTTVTKSHRAILVVFTVEAVGRLRCVLAKLASINAQITDGEMLAHIEERAVNGGQSALSLSLRGSRGTLLAVAQGQTARRVGGKFKDTDILVGTQTVLLIEMHPFKHHAVEAVNLPTGMDDSQ